MENKQGDQWPISYLTGPNLCQLAIYNGIKVGIIYLENIASI